MKFVTLFIFIILFIFISFGLVSWFSYIGMCEILARVRVSIVYK